MKKLTEGSITAQLIRLTLPMVWGVFAIVAFNLADTFFVGQLGTDELAAMSFTFPVVMVLGSVAMGLGIGASSVISRAIGEGDRYRVQCLTTNALTLSLVIVAICAAIGLATIEPLFQALGAGPNVLPFIQEYMSIWYLGVVFLVVPMVGNNAIRASGNTFVPSIIMTVASFVNIGLDPLLIFGFGPIPALGLSGAAIATVIARATTLVASLFVLYFQERMITFNFPQFKTILECWRSVLIVGIPAAATNTIQPISVAVITRLMAGYGPTAVAGFGVASRIESLAIIALMALSASIGPFVGQNWGAKKYGRVNLALQQSFLFCLFWGVLAAVILAFSAPWIASRFDNHPDVVDIATTYLRVVPISYAAYGIVLISSATFNALGKPKPSVIMALTRLVFLYVPLAYVGSFLFGVIGIFAAACLANLAVGIGAYLWNRRTCSLTARSDLPSLN